MGITGKREGIAGPAASAGLRYGLAFASVAAALGLARIFLYFDLPQPFAAFALTAIAITFWYGGTGPGTLAALLSALVRTFFFAPEVDLTSRIIYDFVFLIFAVLMVQVTRARDVLEVRVAERTAALTHANEDLRVEIAERTRAEEKLRQSEAYLSEAQRLTHTGSWVWRVPGRDALHLSEEWFRIYGFDPEDGMPTWEERLQRIHPEDRAKWQGALDQAIMEKFDYEVEFRILLPSGSVKHIHTVGHPVLNASGDLVQFVGSSTDITERKQAEEKIRQSEMELRQILDFAPQCVAVLGPDRDRTRLYANQTMLDYFGFTLEEWRRSDRCKYYHPDDWERLTSETQSQFLSGLPHEYEARFLGKDGKYRWFLFRWNPLRDEQGRVTRWYAAATDI